jgi:hypothetical protein
MKGVKLAEIGSFIESLIKKIMVLVKSIFVIIHIIMPIVLAGI